MIYPLHLVEFCLSLEIINPGAALIICDNETYPLFCFSTSGCDFIHEPYCLIMLLFFKVFQVAEVVFHFVLSPLRNN